MIIPMNVRLHRQSRHHRDDVEKQNYISGKWIRGILTQKDLEVSPQNLRAEPHAATERHQRPKKLSFLVTSSEVRENRECRVQQQSTLRQVAKSGESNGA